MQYTKIKNTQISRFILGSNPFSGFSHQGAERDREMVHYYSVERIKETIRAAESLGVTTLIARSDHHVIRMLTEYWDEGGQIQWFAQTCPEIGDDAACAAKAAAAGAKACHLHGGVMDARLAGGRMEESIPLVARIRELGMLAGVAGHNTGIFEWAEEHLDVDYYMCCYYDPVPRTEKGEHADHTGEVYNEADREAMTALIPKLSKPVIHYKIMAAGRNEPTEAFRRAAATMRATDAVCVGVYTKDGPDMLREDVELLDRELANE